MKKKDLDKFRLILLKERDKITQHLNDLEGASVDELAQSGGDSVDLAAQEITQLAIQKLGNREKKLLEKIALSLEKIESGEYGICERCGEDIAHGRLEARPVTQYCIDCKTELEQNEKRYSEGVEDEDGESSWEGETYDDMS